MRKREKLLRKIPQIEKLDMPDATGIIISGIMNFGNDSDTIRAMAKDAIGCDAGTLKSRMMNLSLHASVLSTKSLSVNSLAP